MPVVYAAMNINASKASSTTRQSLLLLSLLCVLALVREVIANLASREPCIPGSCSFSAWVACLRPLIYRSNASVLRGLHQPTHSPTIQDGDTPQQLLWSYIGPLAVEHRRAIWQAIRDALKRRVLSVAPGYAYRYARGECFFYIWYGRTGRSMEGSVSRASHRSASCSRPWERRVSATR